MSQNHLAGRRIKAAVVILSSTLSISGASACSAESHDWKVYGNARYGYSVCYPPDVFRPRPEPDAHDGVLFDGPAGVVLSVSGESSPASNLREVLDLVVKTLDGRSTYTAAGPSWRVASGKTHGKVFYSRVVAGENVIAQYVLVYPKRLSATFTPIVKRINACMKIG